MAVTGGAPLTPLRHPIITYHWGQGSFLSYGFFAGVVMGEVSARCRKFHRAPIVLALELLALLLPISLLYCLLRIPIFSYRIPFIQDPFYLNLAYRAACVLCLFEIWHRYFNNMYVFGLNRVMLLQGRMAVRMRRVSISYRDIREIRIIQTPMGRLFNYGNLYLGTASIEGIEIIFRDIPDPHGKARIIDEQSAYQRLTGDGAAALEGVPAPRF